MNPATCNPPAPAGGGSTVASFFNSAGTLVETDLARFNAEDVGRILRSCDRTKAGRTAPPQGLYLIKVLYEETV